MSNLVVVCYPDLNRAQEVLNTLQRLGREALIDLEDAVIVTKRPDGKITMNESVNMAQAGAISGGTGGALWGTLIGLLFLAPLAGLVIGAATGAAAGAVAGKARDYGVDDTFIKQVGNSLQPGSSAIFLLVRRATVDKVLPEVSKFGGQIIHTSLSKEGEQHLQAALTSGDPSATSANPAPAP